MSFLLPSIIPVFPQSFPLLLIIPAPSCHSRLPSVIPAEAGIHLCYQSWTPAFARVTERSGARVTERVSEGDEEGASFPLPLSHSRLPSVIPAPSCHSRGSGNPSLLSILDPRFREGDRERWCEGDGERWCEGDRKGTSFPRPLLSFLPKN